MADIVVIKVGCNEPETHEKYDQLYHHLDIIDIMPRKRDAQGNLLNRGLGAQGDKEFLGLAVDMSHMDDTLFSQFRTFIRANHEQEVFKANESDDCVKGATAYNLSGQKDGPLRFFKELKRRKICCDMARQDFLSAPTQDNIITMKNTWENKQTRHQCDMRTVNRYDKVVPFDEFVDMVFSKRDGMIVKDFMPAKYRKPA